jgi:hypothetical protein
MPRVQRLSDLIEIQAEQAIYYAVPGVLGIVFGSLLVYYRGDTQVFLPLGIVLLLIGTGAVGIAIRAIWKVRNVTGFTVVCPFCETKNELLEQPPVDFACEGCSRMIPIDQGTVMQVFQVRCGYCNELNYYSEKTDALLCENCNHEIPIATNSDKPAKAIPKAYMVIDDEALYELTLKGKGRRQEEELIQALQHILALNRNQVKQMLDELPVTVLTGITRKKAEMLAAQLSIYDAEVEFKPMEEAHR